MIKELIALATDLDQKGLSKEADEVDQVIKKMAQEWSSNDFGSFDLDLHSDEEDPSEWESMQSYKDDEEAAELATLIAGGDPVTGEDEESLVRDLTDLLSSPEHSDLVHNVMRMVKRQVTPPVMGEDEYV